MEKVVSPNLNPFMPIPEDLQPKQDKPREWDKTNKVYNLIPKAKKVIDVDGIEHDVVVFEPVFIREYDIQEYIASFSGEVGIQNILKKLSITGDKSILNQTGREPLNPDGGLEPVQDYSNVPSNKTEAFNLVLEGVKAYDELPAEIKGKMSFSQVATLVQAEDVEAYIKSLMPKEEGGNQ